MPNIQTTKNYRNGKTIELTKSKKVRLLFCLVLKESKNIDKTVAKGQGGETTQLTPLRRTGDITSGSQRNVTNSVHRLTP